MLPVAKRKSRRAKRRALFEENFVKTQKVLEARPIRPPQGRSEVGTQRLLKLKNTRFWKKTHFFTKHFYGCLVGAGRSGSLSWCHFLCVLGPPFLLLQVTHFFIFWSCLGVLCSEGTPERVFWHFFRKRFRTRACTDLQCTFAQKCFLFCNVKKVCWQDLIGYAAWGLPQGPAFAYTLTMSNKTKKQKLKKTQVLFGILR